MKDSLRRGAIAAIAVAIAAAPLAAQLKTARSIPETYAITNARIVPVSSAAIEKGTIVIRDGLISAVGANVRAPGDARIIDGTGLTVYPGLIDSYTSLGLGGGGAPAGGGRGGRGGGGAAAANSPEVATMSNNRPGLRPEDTAVELLKDDPDAFAGPQSVGITTALTAPATGIYMGQSALINLGGSDAADLVVKAPVSLNIGFTPLRTGYPSSLLGVFSALRQSLLDAQHYRDVAAIYAKSPRGMKRPEFDPSLNALQPVISGQMPVVMLVDSKREIERALGLAKEFNLKLIIAGGAEAYTLTDQLKAAGVPVLLSVDYPKRAPQGPDADPEPLRVLRDRVEAPKAAGRLEKAGVKFALESGNITTWAEFSGNVQRAVEEGLTEDAALKALTWQAADIFGASDRLGSIETGKIADLTITRGTLFDHNSRVTQLFIDGRPVEVRAQTAGGAAITATGNWNVVATLDGGDHTIFIALQEEGGRLNGSYSGSLGAGEVTNGTIGGDGNFRFTATLIVGGLTEECTFSGSLTGNAVSGTIRVVGEPTTPGKFVGTRPQGGGRGGRGGRPPQDRE